jgi:hypothetical protein
LNLVSLNAPFKKKMDEMDTRFSQLEEKVRTQRPRPLVCCDDDIREYISKVSLWSKPLDAPEKYDYLAFGLRGEAEAWFIQAAETTPKKVDTFNALSDALIEAYESSKEPTWLTGISIGCGETDRACKAPKTTSTTSTRGIGSST